jgi:hypothetical protein
MEFAVTFLELDMPESYRANRPHRILPQAVLVGLAERAISTAAANLVEYEIEVLTSKARSSKGESSARATVEGKLIQLAMEEMKALVASEEADVVLAASPEHSEFEREIERQVQKVRVPEKRIGRRFYEAKVQAGEGTLRQVRSIGTSSLLMAGLSTEQRLQATRNWEREWSHATVPWGSWMATSFGALAERSSVSVMPIWKAAPSMKQRAEVAAGRANLPQRAQRQEGCPIQRV